MYFVRSEALKQRLKSREFSDRETLPYLIAYVSLGVLLMGVLNHPVLVTPYNSWDWLSVGLSSLLGIAGVVYSYQCNGGKEGHDLILKYIVLGWVVSIRCVLVLIPILILVYMGGLLFGWAGEATGLFDVLILFVFELILYWRLGENMRDTVDLL